MECAIHSRLRHGKRMVSRLLPANSRGRPAKNLTSANGSASARRTCCKASRRIKIPWYRSNLQVRRMEASQDSTNGIRKTSARASRLICLPAPPGQCPQTVPSSLDTGGFAIPWGLDNRIKTPYSYTLDFSVGRQLPKGFALEVSYVGRLSHWLWAQSDLAMPLDLVDKKSGLDYFKALTALAKIYRTGVSTDGFNPSMVPANVAQYWADMSQPLQAGDMYATGACGPNPTNVPVVAIYDLMCGFGLNETTGLVVLDYFGFSGT